MTNIAHLPNATLAELIHAGRQVRDQVEQLNNQIKELEAQRRNLDAATLQLMSEQGIQNTAISSARVAVSTQEIANVTDWESFYQYIHQHHAFHLLHRRISAAAAAEIVRLDGELPGVEVSEQPRLNFTRR